MKLVYSTIMILIFTKFQAYVCRLAEKSDGKKEKEKEKENDKKKEKEKE